MYALIDRIIKMYLKMTRKHYLVPFIEGLVNLGRPSSVTFPVELLEQGLGLVLSGLSNTMATQTNLDWVWPYWLERQQDPDDGAFVPTGVNLLCANLTRRNWVSLGVADSHRESMVDPVGMLTPKAFGWSVFPFVRMEEGLFLPPRMQGIDQQPEDGYLPGVITHYPLPSGLHWRSRALGLMVGGEELISFCHYLKNAGPEPVSLTFGLALRPYNPLTLGHINRLKYKNRLWRVNGKPGLLMLEDPSRVSISDRHLGDPLLLPPDTAQKTSFSSRSGILGGCWELDINLQPGEARKVESMATLARQAHHPKIKFRGITPGSVREAREKTVRFWQKNAVRGTLINVPDKRLEQAFYTVKNHLHAFDDGTHFSPGTFFYHGHWFRDSAFIALGFENVGFGHRIASKFPGFLERQNGDGFFRSQNGEWDSNGQAIWTIINHARRNNRVDLLEQYYPAMRKGCQWLQAQCNKTIHEDVPHAGLLPSGISAEHFGPNDHYFWDNFWGVAGLESTHWAAQRLGRESDANRLEDHLGIYRDCLEKAIAEARTRANSDVLPTSPYRNPDNAAIGNLVAVTPLDVLPPDIPWFQPTVNFLMDHNLRDGLFFQKIIHTGLNAYLSVQLARALLALGDKRWFDVLQALMHFGAPNYTWPEAIHPRTGGGCMGDGDHGWAAAEFISLIREMMVREQGNELHLGAGIPETWLKPGEEISVSGATTLAGDLSYSLSNHNGPLRFTWELSPGELSQSMPLYLILPRSFQAAKSLPFATHLQKVPLPGETGELTFLPSSDTDNQPSGVVDHELHTPLSS